MKLASASVFPACASASRSSVAASTFSQALRAPPYAPRFHSRDCPMAKTWPMSRVRPCSSRSRRFYRWQVSSRFPPPTGDSMTRLRILIADDHSVVRAGLRTLLESHANWEVCAEAADGRDAVEKASKLKPDVAVLDIGMPLLNGVEAARRIHKASPNTEILVLTMHESDDLVQQVVEAGARGYILKDDADRVLHAAIDALRQHKPYFSTRVSTPPSPRGRQIQQRSRLPPRYQRQHCGSASCQYHVEAQPSLPRRTRPLRHPQ